MSNFVLSICVITMNRALQLQEALLSCLACKLPEKTEFVIVDNASTDNTEQIVHETLNDCGYPFYYEKLAENKGVGGGRNYAFNKCSGQYVYVLDDDAVIDEKNPEFFNQAVDILEKHPEVVTLTTQIYDTAWKKNRVSADGREIYPYIYLKEMFCGGSHFLKKSFFGSDPYLGNRYGYEEIIPSMRVADAGYINICVPDLLVIHKPAVDKWDYTKNENEEILIMAFANPYAIKKMLYPKVFMPILFLCYTLRKAKYIKSKECRKKADALCKEITKEYPIEQKIKFMTVMKQVKEFGISVF
ncbi:MAG: glycosyltransferase family 2 protein [Ruminococcaceae bacterium]|nr:glycosyltransferase family 2 protein [Oscillospiraceae bacterium]